MTTKKQRRAAVAAKREKFDEAMRLSGLAAQRKSRENQNPVLDFNREDAEANRRAVEQMAQESAARILSDPTLNP